MNNFSHLPPAATDDREGLLAKAQIGDEDAIGEILQSFKCRLTRYVWTIMKNRTLAEDIFQETCLRAISLLRAGRFDNMPNFSGWLFTVARNLAINTIHAYEHTHPLWVAEDEFDRSCGHSESSQLDAALLGPSLRSAVAQLPDTLREVVTLRIGEQLTGQEVANRLGMTRANVSLLEKRARKQLTKHLRRTFPNDPILAHLKPILRSIYR